MAYSQNARERTLILQLEPLRIDATSHDYILEHLDAQRDVDALEVVVPLRVGDDVLPFGHASWCTSIFDR